MYAHAPVDEKKKIKIKTKLGHPFDLPYTDSSIILYK